MVVAVGPFVVALMGALLYAFSTNPKLQEIGRILFFVGAFWLVSTLTGRALHL